MEFYLKTFEVMFIRMLNVLYSHRFYIEQKFIFIIFKESSGYICKNILYTMKFIFVEQSYLLKVILLNWLIK